MLKALSLKKCSSLQVPPKIWNIQDLLQWLRTHVPPSDSIFQVFRHVAFLLLVASGRRIHDLTLRNIVNDHCEILDSSVTFWPRFGSKTDSSKYRQSGWELHCSGDPALRLVIWVKNLISITANRRKSREGLNSIFNKAATRTVIAGWLKAPFAELGIDCGPGSIRSAVASYNYQQNVLLDIILERGNWRGSENFFKHYCKTVNKPLSNDSKVLNDFFKTI